MHRIVGLFVYSCLALVVAGCGTGALTPEQASATLPPTERVVSLTIVPTDTVIVPTLVEPADTAIPVPTDTTIPPTAVPTDTVAPPTAVPTEPPVEGVQVGDVAIVPADVHLYPVAQIYAGERVTFRLNPSVSDELAPRVVGVEIEINGEEVVDGSLGGWSSFSNEAFGFYQWVWTAEPGVHSVRVTLDPENKLEEPDEGNNSAEITFVVPETTIAKDVWEAEFTDSATVYFISGTDAHRDKEKLLALVESAVQKAASTLGVTPEKRVTVYFIDRVIGQGGYAGSSMVISYLDRNYSGGGLYEVLVHESIHVLDDQFVNADDIRFLTEGLAVWGAGGHYKLENLDARAGGLLLDTQNRYVPLRELVDNFYPAQHEVSYLQGGGFVNFLVETYGWEAVKEMYANSGRRDGESPATALDRTLSTYFNKSLEQLETDWHVYLQGVARSAEDALDLELTIKFYDVMRDYQKAHDPTAYFRYAWLPAPDVLREQNITAELTRNPEKEVNRVYETMLDAADRALRDGDFAQAGAILDSVSRSLEMDKFNDPLAQNYVSLVQLADEQGLVAENITFSTVDGVQLAEVRATDSANQLIELTYNLDGQNWVSGQ